MSVNARKKRRAKARHRDEFSRWPLSQTNLCDMIWMIAPLDTPLMGMLRRGQNDWVA